MKQPDENQMFDWVDQLKLKQEHVRQEVPMTGAAKDLNESEGAALLRIQSLTFAKLGLEQPERLVTTSHSAAQNDDVPAVQFIRTRKNVQRRWALAAALAGVIIVSAFSLLSPEVRAQVRKVIQFLPGFAVVQEAGEKPVRYVLPAPVVKTINGGKLEIRGIQIGDSLSQIAVTGYQLAMPDTMEMVNQDGERYVFKQSGWQSGGRGWTTGFWYKGPIHVTDSMKLNIEELGGEQLSINLKKASQAERMEDLGSTSVSNGISLTAIPTPTEGNKTKVTLIPQLPPQIRLMGFGLSQYEYLEQPKLTTHNGVEIPIERDNVFPNISELFYEKASQESNQYRLLIPSFAFSQQLDKPLKITVPIPAEGTTSVGKQVQILGFPVDIVQTERVKLNEQGKQVDHIRVYFDVHYDPAAVQSLKTLSLDMMKQNGGYGTMHDEQTMVIQYMEIPIEPGQKKTFDLYIAEGQLVHRGPWELEWND